MGDETFWLTGLFPAVFTPMHADGSVNLDLVPEVVEHLINDGVNGLYVCGSTGEGFSLTIAERKEVSEAYLQAVDSRLPVIIQVGHNSLLEARGLAEHAQAIGADAISAVPPSYYQIGNVEILIDCLSVILDGAPKLPFYYYHIPRLTHFELDVVSFLEKAEKKLPLLKGVKYSNFTVFELQACAELDGGHFNILFGSDEMLLAGLSAGAHGAVGSTYNFSAPLYRKIIQAFKEDDIGSAKEWQSHAVEMVRKINSFGSSWQNGSALKAMMAVIGLDCGPPRLPQVSLSKDSINKMRDDLHALGFFDWGRK